MSIDPWLLENLACPVCKTPVKLEEDGQAFFCSQCRRLYPVRNDVPDMLVENAQIKEK